MVLDVFLFHIIGGVMMCNILNNKSTKENLATLGVSRRYLSDVGLGSFVTILVCWQIN